MAEQRENAIERKSFAFAVRIVRLSQFLREEKREFVLSKQILRSGTSIGANVREAVYAASRKDFINKLHIALKEANETAYWIELLGATEYLTQDMSASIHQDCIELRKLLIQILKSTKERIHSDTGE